MELNRKQNFKICLSGLFLAIGLVLPFLTGQIPEIGKMLSPMHLPVILCGFLCGYKYGLIIGFTMPLLRSLLFSMPVFYPSACSMALEMAIYGLLSGLFSKKIDNVFKLYLFLIITMVIGRLSLGIINPILLGITNTPYSFKAFIYASFINAWPGIILQIAIIPPIVLLFNKLNSKL